MNKAVFAISLTGATNSKTVPYSVDGGKGLLTANEVLLLNPQNKNNDFMQTLAQNFKESDGWKFKWSETSLEGKFTVTENEPAFGVARDYFGSDRVVLIGSKFQLFYFSPLLDNNLLPTDLNKYHWIQRVSNYDMTGKKGDSNDFIDVPTTQNNPFYNLQNGFQGLLTPGMFQDQPYKGTVKEDNTFLAELYLAEVSNPNNPTLPQEVTIYDGVSWGWKSKFSTPKSSYLFSDSLAVGWETDNFLLNGLTPGASFSAWIDNNLTTNQCNPNTLLSANHPSGFGSGYDDNSSPVGDGFASAVSGIIGRDGIINLSVQAATPGGRGEDRGNYNLYFNVYEAQKSPPPEVPEFNIVAGSGGGGVGNETPGRRQQNPILANTIDQQGWQIFSNVPGCRWYDPPTTYGFEFQALENTLFTEILDFPFGDDNLFTVSTGNRILGEFSPDQNVDFVSLLGGGVKSFNITGIDSIFGTNQETAFPIQLAFNKNTGSFKMRLISQPKSVPEPHSIFGLFTLGIWAGFQGLKIKKSKQP